MTSMQQMFFIFCVLPGSIAMGSDWTTEMCNSGMCFNGEAECRESCDRLCRQQRAQGFCYFDNFLSRVFICWCSFDQSKSSPTTTETTTTTAAATTSTEVSTILSVLTRTDAEDCGTTSCYFDIPSCDSACANRCQPELYSCDRQWHGRYKCQCIQEVIIQTL
ncbi:uncharacterized protein LOC111131559 [Crassostrea virginica]